MGGRQEGESGDECSDHGETLDTTTKSIRAQDDTTKRIGPAWRPVTGLFFFDHFYRPFLPVVFFVSSFLFLIRCLIHSVLFFFPFVLFLVIDFLCSCSKIIILVVLWWARLSSCQALDKQAGHDGSSASGPRGRAGVVAPGQD